VHALRATRIAVEAEALRLRLRARRAVIQAILGLTALAFLTGALALAHVAAWYWLRLNAKWTPPPTAALLAAVDLVIAGVLATVMLRLGPGRTETEARLVRQQASRSLFNSASWAAIVLRVLDLLRRPRPP
jgi:hypothetical protein